MSAAHPPEAIVVGALPADAVEHSLSSGRLHWQIPLLAFLTVFLDGFDTTSIGFVVPTLARQWGVPAAAFTGSFVATSLGAVIGYMLSGRLAALLGRRSLLLWSVALFALGSLATVLAASLVSLAILRLVTSIGLGAALPVAVSLAVARVSAGRRETMTIAVVSGLSFGATVGGIAAGRLITQFGWTSLFVAGGILPLLLWPALWFVIPRDTADTTAPNRSAGDAVQPSRVGQLFNGALRWQTTALWSFAFFVFIAIYALISWVPSLLVAMGFSPVEAPLGGAALGAGGLVRALLLVPLSAWLGTRRVLVITTLLALALVVVIGKADLGRSALLLCVGALGACLISGTLGQSALAVAIYPADSRTSGIGWSAALGRVGSIVGPAVGGALMAAGMGPREVVMSAVVPIVAAVGALIVFGMVAGRSR